MLTELYIEALLADEELADQVWEDWNAGEIDRAKAEELWWGIVAGEIARNVVPYI